MSAPKLHVAAVQAKGILGIVEGSIEPGRVTMISGRNGSAKTSWIEALRAGIGGGSLAKIAHVEEGQPSKAELVIVLKGDQEYRIEKKGGDTARVLARIGDSQAFEDVGKPQAWLSSLFDVGGCSIVDLLKAKDKDLATLILEALPLELDRAELGKLLQDLPKGVVFRPVPKGLHALEELAQTREDVFTARTGVNRDLDMAKKSAEQLRRALPATLPADNAQARAKLQTQRDALAEKIAADRKGAAAAEELATTEAGHAYELVKQEVTASFNAARAKLRSDHEAAAAGILAEAERRIAEIRAAAQQQIDQAKTSTDQAIEVLQESDQATLDKAYADCEAAYEAARKARAAADTARQEKEGQLALLNQQLAELQRDAETAHKAQGLVDQVKVFDESAAAHKEEADRLTDTLDALDSYRLRLAKALPVPGLEISGSVVRVDGVPWAQLNKAQRVGALVKVAVLRAQGRPLPLILVDDAETLDTEHLELLVDELKASGVQALITRVTDTPLQVETLA